MSGNRKLASPQHTTLLFNPPAIGPVSAQTTQTSTTTTTQKIMQSSVSIPQPLVGSTLIHTPLGAAEREELICQKTLSGDEVEDVMLCTCATYYVPKEKETDDDSDDDIGEDGKQTTTEEINNNKKEEESATAKKKKNVVIKSSSKKRKRKVEVEEGSESSDHEENEEAEREISLLWVCYENTDRIDVMRIPGGEQKNPKNNNSTLSSSELCFSLDGGGGGGGAVPLCMVSYVEKELSQTNASPSSIYPLLGDEGASSTAVGGNEGQEMFVAVGYSNGLVRIFRSPTSFSFLRRCRRISIQEQQKDEDGLKKIGGKKDGNSSFSSAREALHISTISPPAAVGKCRSILALEDPSHPGTSLALGFENGVVGLATPQHKIAHHYHRHQKQPTSTSSTNTATNVSPVIPIIQHSLDEDVRKKSVTFRLQYVSVNGESAAYAQTHFLHPVSFLCAPAEISNGSNDNCMSRFRKSLVFYSGQTDGNIRRHVFDRVHKVFTSMVLFSPSLEEGPTTSTASSTAVPTDSREENNQYIVVESKKLMTKITTKKEFALRGLCGVYTKEGEVSIWCILQQSETHTSPLECMKTKIREDEDEGKKIISSRSGNGKFLCFSILDKPTLQLGCPMTSDGEAITEISPPTVSYVLPPPLLKPIVTHDTFQFPKTEFHIGKTHLQELRRWYTKITNASVMVSPPEGMRRVEAVQCFAVHNSVWILMGCTSRFPATFSSSTFLRSPAVLQVYDADTRQLQCVKQFGGTTPPALAEQQSPAMGTSSLSFPKDHKKKEQVVGHHHHQQQQYQPKIYFALLKHRPVERLWSCDDHRIFTWNQWERSSGEGTLTRSPSMKSTGRISPQRSITNTSFPGMTSTTVGNSNLDGQHADDHVSVVSVSTTATTSATAQTLGLSPVRLSTLQNGDFDEQVELARLELEKLVADTNATPLPQRDPYLVKEANDIVAYQRNLTFQKKAYLPQHWENTRIKILRFSYWSKWRQFLLMKKTTRKDEKHKKALEKFLPRSQKQIRKDRFSFWLQFAQHRTSLKKTCQKIWGVTEERNCQLRREIYQSWRKFALTQRRDKIVAVLTSDGMGFRQKRFFWKWRCWCKHRHFIAQQKTAAMFLSRNFASTMNHSVMVESFSKWEKLAWQQKKLKSRNELCRILRTFINSGVRVHAWRRWISFLSKKQKLKDLSLFAFQLSGRSEKMVRIGCWARWSLWTNNCVERRSRLITAGRALLFHSQKFLRQFYFHQWVKFRKEQMREKMKKREAMDGTAHAMLATTGKGLLRVYMRKWLRWQQLQKGIEEKQSVSNVALLLLRHTSKVCLTRVYFRKWEKFLSVKKRNNNRKGLMQVIASETDAGMRLVYLKQKWIPWLHQRQREKKRRKIAILFQRSTDRQLMAIFFIKWKKYSGFLQLREKQKSLTNFFEVAAFQRLRKKFFSKWIAFMTHKAISLATSERKKLVFYATNCNNLEKTIQDDGEILQRLKSKILQMEENYKAFDHMKELTQASHFDMVEQVHAVENDGAEIEKLILKTKTQQKGALQWTHVHSHLKKKCFKTTVPCLTQCERRLQEMIDAMTISTNKYPNEKEDEKRNRAEEEASKEQKNAKDHRDGDDTTANLQPRRRNSTPTSEKQHRDEVVTRALFTTTTASSVSTHSSVRISPIPPMAKYSLLRQASPQPKMPQGRSFSPMVTRASSPQQHRSATPTRKGVGGTTITRPSSLNSMLYPAAAARQKHPQPNAAGSVISTGHNKKCSSSLPSNSIPSSLTSPWDRELVSLEQELVQCRQSLVDALLSLPETDKQLYAVNNIVFGKRY